MPNLTFIPAAAPAKPAQDLRPQLTFENQAATVKDSFERFLKGANEKLKNDRTSEKFGRVPSEVTKVKPELKQDEFKTADQIGLNERDSSKPQQKAEAVDETGEVSQPKNEAEEKVADEALKEEGQALETSEAVNSGEILALLAHLAEVEGEIRGETQPETIQMAEVSEAMSSTEPIGAVVAEVNHSEVLNPSQLESRAKVTSAEPNQEKATEGKTFDLSQLNQVVKAASGNTAHEERSLANQGENFNAKEGLVDSIKVTNAQTIGVEGEQTFAQTFSVADHRSQQVENPTQVGGNRILAHQDQSSKDGKVNLAVIQTHLAVNDEPEVQTGMPVLNLIPSQPTINNNVSFGTSATTGANPANREDLFAQLVEHAKVVVNNGSSEMEVQLRPEHLGKVQLKVSIENEVVTAKFVAESQQVKEIIESNLGQLKREMQNNGMQVESIMVSVGQQQSGESFEETANRQEGFGRFTASSFKDEEELNLAADEPRRAARVDTVIDLIA